MSAKQYVIRFKHQDGEQIQYFGKNANLKNVINIIKKIVSDDRGFWLYDKAGDATDGKYLDTDKVSDIFDKEILCEIQAIIVVGPSGRHLRYEIDPEKTTGEQLKRLVSAEIGVSVDRVNLIVNNTQAVVTDDDILDDQGIGYYDALVLILRKSIYIVMEHRNLGGGPLGKSSPFSLNGMTSPSTGRLLQGSFPSLDSALMAIGQPRQMPIYDPVTFSYSLYREGPVEFRAYDISALIPQ